jgi:O-antigen/teichoic acid export membrane protein
VAGVYLFYNVLTCIRKQVNILISYLLVAISTTVLSPILVQRYQINGASIAYLVSSIELFVIFLFLLILNINRDVKK